MCASKNETDEKSDTYFHWMIDGIKRKQIWLLFFERVPSKLYQNDTLSEGSAYIQDNFPSSKAHLHYLG